MPMQPAVIPSMAFVRTGEGVRTFGLAWRKLERSITRYVHLVTPERAAQDDLLQVAMIELWKLDPTRYDLRNRSDMAYMRRTLVTRICDAWGSDRRTIQERADSVVSGLTDTGPALVTASGWR